MNIFAFVLATLLIGLATGKLVGARLAFTRGRARADLFAGVLGALVGALPLHLLGPAGYREPFPALLIGLSVAMLATWLRRIVRWKKESMQPLAMKPGEMSEEHHRHFMLTTAEGTRFLLGGGRLTIDETRGGSRPSPAQAPPAVNRASRSDAPL